MGAEDYGMKVWDASGNLKLDVTDRVTRLRLKFVIGEGGESGNSGALSDIAGHSSAQFVISTGNHLPHVATRSGTTIYWATRSSGGEGVVMCFLY